MTENQKKNIRKGVIMKKPKILIPNDKPFGHTHVITGFREPYLHYKSHGITDGTGKRHVTLYGSCDICGKEIEVAMIHVKGDSKLFEKTN